MNQEQPFRYVQIDAEIDGGEKFDPSLGNGLENA